MNRELFLETVRGLIGLPYIHQGRTNAGVDCTGLIILAYKMNGLDVITSVDNYGRTPQPQTLRKDLGVNFVYVSNKLNDAQPGDIILTRIRYQAQHTVIHDGKYFIHALGGGPDKVIREKWRPLWEQRVLEVYTHKDDD